MSTDPVQDPTRDGNDPEELRSRFNAVVLETIETLLPGLAALYVLYSALSLAMLSTDAGAAMALALTAAVSAAGHIFLRSALRRGRIPVAKAHAVAAGVAMGGLLNSLLHMVLMPDGGKTTALIVLSMAAGCTFLSLRWLLVVLTATLLGWMAVSELVAPTHEWFQFGVALFASAAISVAVHTARMRSYKTLHRAHLSEITSLDSADASLEARGELEGLLDWDLKTDKVYFSPRWMSMLGYEKERIDPTPEA